MGDTPQQPATPACPAARRGKPRLHCRAGRPRSFAHCPDGAGSLSLATMFFVTILGSGSAGNCALVETAQTRLLIDGGLSARQIGARLALCGVNPLEIDGILLTHEHGDHAGALDVWCKQFHWRAAPHRKNVILSLPSRVCETAERAEAGRQRPLASVGGGGAERMFGSAPPLLRPQKVRGPSTSSG